MQTETTVVQESPAHPPGKVQIVPLAHPIGLDSVTVMFLDSTSFIDTGFRSDVTHSFRWPVRAGIPAGTTWRR